MLETPHQRRLQNVGFAAVVGGLLLWIVAVGLVSVNGRGAGDALVATAWVTLPVAVGFYSMLSPDVRPTTALVVTVLSAVPVVGTIPASMLLAYTYKTHE